MIEDTIADEMEILWTTQRDAAFTHGWELSERKATDWRNVDWRFYRDPTEFEYPHTAADLQDQLTQIGAMENRSFEDKAYLAQKSYTRYLISYVSQRGGTNDLYRYLYDSAGSGTKMQAKGMLHMDDEGFEGSAGRHYIAPWMNDGEQIFRNS